MVQRPLSRLCFELMRCNSRFGWDPVTKKFTVSDEVWDEYFKDNCRKCNCLGRYSIGLGDDDDARTFEAEETSSDVLEDLTYDYDAEAFVQINEHQQKNLNQPPTVGIFNAPPTIEPINLEVSRRV
ncbi:hypothetical protein Syun_020316 [Stephania yunnanensis]|uniref:Myb/SANT-like domain-containing protein n=1 Tax=Stephania yunnanensis TaxID=152371 RepID=A0AAP0IDK3_9MAGN